MLWDVLQPIVLKHPNKSRWQQIATVFGEIWNCPNVLGSIDGKHVMIQAPPNAGSSYYNYKGTHSIVLLAVCDARYCFTLVDVGSPGRNSDGGVLSRSTFGQKLECGQLDLPDPAPLPGTDEQMPFLDDEVFPLNKTS